MKETTITKVWKQVFSSPNYILLAVCVALAFYFFNVIIIQWKNLAIFNLKFLIIIVFQGFYYVVEKQTFYTTIIIAVLTGILVSLLVYKYKYAKKMQTEKLSFLASIGLFLGILAPGCASCGIGLAALFGLSSSILYLPFKGVEISIAAIILIAISIYSVSKSLTKAAVCRIN